MVPSLLISLTLTSLAQSVARQLQTSSSCSTAQWLDAFFGLIQYQAGQPGFANQISISNDLQLTDCSTEVVSFFNDSYQDLSWLGQVTSDSQNLYLTIIMQNDTQRTGYWGNTQPWSISFTISMRSTASNQQTFNVYGTIELTNPCLYNEITDFPDYSFTLAQLISFVPDLSNLHDLYADGLCGTFTSGSISCVGYADQEIYVDRNQQTLNLVPNWDKSRIGDNYCQITFWSTQGATNEDPAAIQWFGNVFTIVLTDPCTSETYAPLQFSQQNYYLDYTICQNMAETIAFEFIDALSALTGQPEYCGTPIFSFNLVDPLLDTQQNLTDSISVTGTPSTGILQIDQKMCLRTYNNGTQTAILSGAIDLSITINCYQCIGQPFIKTVTLNFVDPCVYANIIDSQPWYDALPVDTQLSQWHLINVGLGQPLISFDLTENYLPDNVTQGTGIELFCGVPSYELSVQDSQGTSINNADFAKLSNQVKASLPYVKYNLTIETNNLTVEGTYKLLVHNYLQPGALSGVILYIELQVDNYCKLENFIFSPIDFGQIDYTFGSNLSSFTQPFAYANLQGATWCNPFVNELYHDEQQNGLYQTISYWAVTSSNESSVVISVNSANNTARVQTQTFFLGLSITNYFSNGLNILIQNVGILVLTDPCFNNSVLPQAYVGYYIYSIISRAHSPVQDQVSNQTGISGFCGVFTQLAYSCKDLSEQTAYLNTSTLDATFVLNWNRQFVGNHECHFDYMSTDYGMQWTGQSYIFYLAERCEIESYKIVSFPHNSKQYIYDLGTGVLEIWFSFTSKLDVQTGIANYCGEGTPYLQFDKPSSSFLTYNFNQTNQTYRFQISSSSASDLGSYLTIINVNLTERKINAYATNFSLAITSINPCYYSTINQLVVTNQTYYLLDPQLTFFIQVTDNCAGCNCSQFYNFLSEPQNNTSANNGVTMNAQSGEFAILSSSLSDITPANMWLATLITVSLTGYPSVPNVTAILYYRIEDKPCLSDISGSIQMSKLSYEYDVCQKGNLIIDFTFSDQVSLLANKPNFCGKPVVKVYYSIIDDLDAVVFQDRFTVAVSASDNSGSVAYGSTQPMCNRTTARALPYQFNLQLYYPSYDVQFDSPQIGIIIRDPCIYTQLQAGMQNFFPESAYQISAFDTPLSLNLSGGYYPDNVTVWAGVDYFCGYPNFQIQLYSQDTILFDSLNQVNNSQLVQLQNGYSIPSYNFTTLSIYSTLYQEIGTYEIVVLTYLNGTTGNLQDTVSLEVLDACLKTQMVNSFKFNNLQYTLESSSINGTFTYTDDTITTKFFNQSGIVNQCGNHSVSCKVLTDTKTTFFTYSTNITLHNYTTTYSVYSRSTSDIGIWQVRCQASLDQYPLVTPIQKEFQVSITAIPVVDPISSACIGSSDYNSCKLFIHSNPPYFSNFPESSSQFLDPQSLYGLDIINLYVQYANNVSLSAVTCDEIEKPKLDQFLSISVFAQDPSFQSNIGQSSLSQATTKALSFGLYCPIENSSQVIYLTILLRWRGVDSIQNAYSLPIYCMPCDQNICQNTSKNYYETQQNWTNKFHPPSLSCGASCQVLPSSNVFSQETQVYGKQYMLTNAYSKPPNRTDPSVMLPDGSGSYLDFGFNDKVPVYLPNGTITKVKMCAPTVQSISNTGLVTIIFSKPIFPIAPNKYDQILLSGVIQVQLMLSSEKNLNESQAIRLYSYNISITEITSSHLQLQLNFSAPQVISTCGTSFDLISISFLNSGRYLKCATSVTPGYFTESRLLQKTLTDKKDKPQVSYDTTIPNGYRIVFPLPPQISAEIAEVITQIVDSTAQATNTFVFSSIILSLVFNVSLSLLWGSINAVQIICCLSFNSVVWPSDINFVFNLLNQITQFDLIDPFSPLPIVNQNIYEWNWSPTDPKGNNLAIVNGGSLTFLPNLGSVALFMHIALVQTMLAPIGRILTAIGIKGRRNYILRLAPDFNTLSNQWLRIFLEAFISLYMFLLLGFQMIKQVPADQRNSQDVWSVNTQYILMVPTMIFPFFILWFSTHHSRWLVNYNKVQFYLKNRETIKELITKSKIQFQTDSVSDLNPLPSEILPSDKRSPQQHFPDIVIQLVDRIEIQNGPSDNSDPALVTPFAAVDKLGTTTKMDMASQKASEAQSVLKREVQSRFGEFTKGYLNQVKVSRKEVKAEREKLDSYIKFSILHHDLKLLSFSAQYYWSIFIMRRVIFLTICVYTNDGYWQSSVYTVLSMFSSAYMAAVNPFEQLRKNRIENFNEILVFLCGVFQLVLSGVTFQDQEKEETLNKTIRSRQFLANLIIAAVVVLLTVNFYITISDLLHQLSLILKKRYARLIAIRKLNRRRIKIKKYLVTESDQSHHFSKEQIDESQFSNVDQPSSRNLLVKDTHSSQEEDVQEMQHQVQIESLCFQIGDSITFQEDEQSQVTDKIQDDADQIESQHIQLEEINSLDNVNFIDKARDRLKNLVNLNEQSVVTLNVSSIVDIVFLTDNQDTEHRINHSDEKNFKGDLKSFRLLERTWAQEREHQYQQRLHGQNHVLKKPVNQLELELELDDIFEDESPVKKYISRHMNEPEPEINDL